MQVRPIKNLAGSGEFAECFFTDARTDESMVVGAGQRRLAGRDVDVGLRARFSPAADQLAMEREVGVVVEAAKRNGAADDAQLADHIAAAYTSVAIMRATSMRVLEALWPVIMPPTPPRPAASSSRRGPPDLGELAMDVAGQEGLVTAGPELSTAWASRNGSSC